MLPQGRVEKGNVASRKSIFLKKMLEFKNLEIENHAVQHTINDELPHSTQCALCCGSGVN